MTIIAVCTLAFIAGLSVGFTLTLFMFSKEEG